MKQIVLFPLVFLISLLPLQIIAQEHGDSHSESDQPTETTEQHESSAAANHEEAAGESEAVFASFNDFPTLHPLVVHFPVVLLYVAFVAQIIGLIVRRREMSWVTLILLLGGFIGALAAMELFHPHPADLPPAIHEVFEKHEYYASITTWLAGIALVFKIISHFWIKRHTWTEVMALLVITGAVITVSLTGHLGTQLTYIENVGPQGNYLEEHHEH